MVDTTTPDGVLQSPRDVLLTNHLFKCLRPVFSCQDQITHGGHPITGERRKASEKKKVAAGTRSIDYRCSVPGLAEFINFPSPAAISAFIFRPDSAKEASSFT